MFRLLPASAIAAALAALPVAANAATYSAVSSFSTAGPIAPFSYGYRIGTGPFIPYDAQTAACAAIAGLDCFYPSTYNNNNLPAVGQNVTGSLISSGSVHIPTDVLFMHPVGLNSQLAAGDTIVRFTAPAAGFYEISGNFQILDDSASGVNVSVEGVGSSFAQSLNGPLNTTAGFSFGDSLLAG
jgi:hypothetical protein